MKSDSPFIGDQPDSRISLCLMGGATGLKYWNDPSDPMPIKIAGNKTLQECIVEETEDYIIYSDGQRVKIEKYVVGTYDKYLERLKESTPMLLGLAEPTVDHARILNEINDLALEELSKIPLTTNSEPIILSPRVIPIPIDFCCRVDKVTGEIYIGEGYENLFTNMKFNFTGEGQSETTIEEPSYYDVTIQSLYAGSNFYFYLYPASNGYDGYITIKSEMPLTTNSATYDRQFVSRDLNGDHVFKIDSTKSQKTIWFGYTKQFSEGANIELNRSYKIYKNVCITKTSAPKPFVRTQMPSGKLSFVTNATSETHSFVGKTFESSYKGTLTSWPVFYSSGKSKESIYVPTTEKGLTGDFLVSNSVNTFNGKNTSKANAGLTDGIMLIGNGQNFGGYRDSFDSFKQLLIYKGNLTEAELKAENTKNIYVDIT